MATIDEAARALELEGMRKEDFSWHPCQVSLSSTGEGLIVDFRSQKYEDIVLNKEEALTHLRFHSIPLEGDECSHIKQGDHVLATHKFHSRSLLYDAKVEERVIRVRHSKRIYCRCTFIIKWLHQEREGETLTVPSSSIVKLATKSITAHPIVSLLLKSTENKNFFGASPFSPIIEEICGEKDLNRLLEKQIEEITNLAVASKGMLDDILSGVKVDVKQEGQCKIVDAYASTIQNVIASHDKNHMKRATRSSKRLQVEMEVEDHPSLASFIQENLSENKPHLSPLAARAALASLMSTTHKHAAMEGTRLFDCSMSDDITMTMKLSSRMSAAPVVSESVKLVNPLRPTKGLSSGILVEEPKTENTTAGSGLAISDTSLTCSMKERKLSQSTNATRITRAAAQRGAEQTKNDLHGKTCAEALESKASNSLRRLTRSAVNKGMFTVEDKQESKENNVALVTKSDFSEGKVTIFESSVWKKKRRLSEKKKQVPSPVDAEITIQAEEGNREEMSTAVETSQKIEGKILNNGTSSQGQKRKTISHGKKEERRFSPQLKSLLHTC